MRSPSPDPWFRSSERDLGMAHHLLGAGFYEGVAFHSQQAAEKILKGLLPSPTLSPPSDGAGPIEPGRPRDLSATPTSSAPPLPPAGR